MSVVLMALVGAAIQFYARDMNVRDMDIRQTQLAAAVMQMIEDDLRATLRTEPVDTAPLEALMAASMGGGRGGGGGAQEEDLSAAGIESEVSPIDGRYNDVNLQSGVAVLQSPGLIGNQNQIQLDLSRLPRLEEYVAMLGRDRPQKSTTFPATSRPLPTSSRRRESSAASRINSAPLIRRPPVRAGGLVRRSLDRRRDGPGGLDGKPQFIEPDGELLAPRNRCDRILLLGWRDVAVGMEQRRIWELPLAVQVRLTMRERTNERRGIGPDAATTTTDPT